MPKVNIREIDNTGSGEASFVENIVAVPGLIIGTENDDPEKNTLVDGLYQDYDSFNEACENAGYILVEALPENPKQGVTYVTPDTADKGYLYAKVVLQMGLPIIYKGAYTANTKLDYENDVDGKATKFFKQFEDKGLYDVRFITTAETNNPKVIIAALKAAGNRGDAQALFSVPEYGSVEAKLVANTEVEETGNDAEATTATEYVYTDAQPVRLKTSELIDKWIQYNFQSVALTTVPRKAPTWGTYLGETYGRYGSMFTPSFVTSFTLGDVSIKNYLAPATLVYLSCFSKNVNQFASWFAMAGSVRGVARLSVDPSLKFGDADIEILEPREAAGQGDPDINLNHVAANVICNIRPYGNIIWGNRTMHPLGIPENGSSTEIQLVASSFLNIRNLVIDIKKRLYRSSRRYTFEPNSNILWINFKASIEPLLQAMASNQGIRSYEINKIKTNKKALLAAQVVITPIEAVEDFDLTIELTDSINVLE